MAAPFGFSVSDFLAVGKLIAQIALELRENGEAAPEYQSLLIELEALERALHQLHTLSPAKHDASRLASIQATAAACKIPLQEFLVKISRFEDRMGTFSAGNNKWKGLPRRMQFKVMFKEDIKTLRAVLASHVATISLLLMTQVVATVPVPINETPRDTPVLQSRILQQLRLLEEIKNHNDESRKQQQELNTEIKNHSSVLDELRDKADEACQRLDNQATSIQDTQSVNDTIQRQTTSILSTVTNMLILVTSGLAQLDQIVKQLHAMMRVCTTFASEIRIGMSKLMEMFTSIQISLQELNCSLPSQLNLPTIKFTTALGESMALPYQLCHHWATFQEMLKLIFQHKPGKSRVGVGKYLIMNARGGRLMGERSWQHAVQPGDHLSMCMVLDELMVWVKKCPFLSCQASISGVEINNGGRTCQTCGRWSLQVSHGFLEALLSGQPLDLTDPRPKRAEPVNLADINADVDMSRISDVTAQHDREKEEIGLYRRIYLSDPPSPLVFLQNLWNQALAALLNTRTSQC